jgi:hypothetical protein
MLATANNLINQFGQYVALVSESTTDEDVSKPWLGKSKSYTGVVVKGVELGIDKNVLSVNDTRLQNASNTFLIAGDKANTIVSTDQILTFGAVLESSIAIPSFPISTNSTVSQTGIYNVDASGGAVTLTLDQTNVDKTVVIVSRSTLNSNSVIVSTQGAETIESQSSYTLTSNYSITGFIKSGTNYVLANRFKIYDPQVISPGGNNLLYKVLAGA